MSTGSEALTGTAGWKRIWVAAALGLGAAVLAVLFFVDPARVPIYPVCLFHQVTGLDCPGCGGLRAAHQLLHGRLEAAWHDNAMLVMSVPILAAAGGVLLFRRAENQPLEIPWRWLTLYAAAWIAFGVLRNLPVPFFARFAP